MSKPETTSRRGQSAPQQTKTPPETRFDAPHKPPANGPPAATAGAEAAPVEPPAGEPVAEQLRRQADQLAAHLRGRQKDLDHREAQVNARVAQLERDARTARLWLTEREAELGRREEQLDRQQGEVQERLERLAAAEDALRRQSDATKSAARHQEQWEADRKRAAAALDYERQRIQTEREAAGQLIRQLLAGVERRRKAVEARAAELQQKTGKPSPDLLAREEVLRRTAEALQSRHRELDKAEARLADAQAKTQQLHQQLSESRRQAQEEARVERQRMAAENRRAMAELDKQRQVVRRRSEQADRAEAALKQLRAELGRMHRETLEIRLATEELWVQLSGAAPPAALTQSLGRIRTRLAEQYRTANAELKTQKKDLEAIRSQLAEQHENLLRQKRQFDEWAAGREEETEKQAARLVARERQLKQNQSDLDEQAARWQAERLDYQHEIRRLQAQLSDREEAMVPA